MKDRTAGRTTAKRAAASRAPGGNGQGAAAAPAPAPPAGRVEEFLRRVIIEGVRPEVEGGAFPAKGTLGLPVIVEADIFTDNADAVSADVLYRTEKEREWRRSPFEELVNDRWRATFPIGEATTYVFTIESWIDHYKRWSNDLQKRVAAAQDVSPDLLIGARLLEEAATRASGADAKTLGQAAAKLSARTTPATRVKTAVDPKLAALASRYADKTHASRYRELRVEVDAPKAEFSTWYEMFPRSLWGGEKPVLSGRQGRAAEGSKHATFRDVERRLPYVSRLGFDVLYLPPIHPIGRTHRKGRNNSLTPGPDDPGSPWAIGAEEGGHKAVNPALGPLADFRRLVKTARDDYGIDVALDIAFQCSPDHPYVREHPEWFRKRPDGSIQYAENPPKKYEDIYPFNFETPAWEALWQELLSVFLYWREQGVRVFRVDNPHTKPFAFWQWLIAELRSVDRDVILLSESFTRPKLMYRLARLGFTQSYTYFAWRNQRWDLAEYFTELTQTPVADFFRPSVWPNTPDILTEYVQQGGRPGSIVRLVLAATLSASYGIYGPAFELGERTPREPGSEEYLHSEKYEVRHWDVEREDSLAELIAIVNRARRENPALQWNRSLRFHATDNDQLIAYSKESVDGANVVLTVVNLDPHFQQAGWLSLPLEDWGVAEGEPYQVHDLIGDSRYTWYGARNYVQLDPHVIPAHIFRLRRRNAAGEFV